MEVIDAVGENRGQSLPTYDIACAGEDRRYATEHQREIEQYRQALARAETEISTLNEAVHSNRSIGVAVGIVAERYGIAPDVAFAYLKRLSQDNNRKLRDLAADLVDHGQLPGHTGSVPDTDHTSRPAL